ncbi:MAG TPA: MASE1 domain-containing protein [Candidatus Methylomirabilis sp.]|nr:MASE1 domain-containing protein [Candidatus Methylomirabilis sp.]
MTVTKSRYLSSWAPVGFVAAAYFGAARLGLLLAFEKTNASPVWPPSGIAFAAVLLWGYRVWPGILLGAFLANVVVFLANQSADLLTIVVASACISIGNTLEALTGGWLLHRLVGARRPFERAQDVFKFVAVALLMCLVSASIGPTSIAVAGMAPWSLYGTMWFTWWTGDTAGVLIVTPLLLAWSDDPRIRWAPRRLGEIALFVLLVLAGRIGFREELFAKEAHYLLGFIPILFLVWAAFRFGQRETVTATFLLSGIAIWDTLHGFGPFVTETPNTSLLLLQTFLGTVAVTAMILAAVVGEGRRAEEALRTLNQKLEERVIERTAELQEAMHVLQEALRVKSEFLANVSHELRTPLNSIIGFSELLEEHTAGPLSEKHKRYAHNIWKSGKHLLRLINDLLDLSKMEAGKIELRPEAFQLPEALRGALTTLRPEAEAKGLKLQLDVETCPATLVADPTQFRQIIDNILSNAVKFTPQRGQVMVIARRIQDVFVEIVVADTGIGIKAEDFAKLFQPFTQLDPVLSKRFQGTGLGLALTKQLVELHGGHIWAESEGEGRGSTFTILLPVAGTPRSHPVNDLR